MFQPTTLASSGPTFSRLVWGVMKWGAWGSQLDAQSMLRLIEEGVELGITSYDHADIYGDYTTEAEFGAALRLQPGLRDKIQLISKCGIRMVSKNRPEHWVKSYETSTEHITTSVERSLRNLHTDYLDLLLIHRPSPLLNPDEVADTFRELKLQGKVRYFGVSNFTPAQYSLLQSRFPLVTNQVEASLLHLEPFFDGTLDQATELRAKPMAWSPLGSGKVFTMPEDPQVQRITAVAQQIAHTRGQDWALDQILLAWLMQHPAGILPVLGTAKTERMKAAIAAGELNLTSQEWFALLQAARGHEVA